MSADITAEEIREIRCSYGLSQRSFATLLGIGVASIVRYEQGSKPSKANANLIRAARYPEFMLECLQRDGGLLSESQRSNATQVIYAVISLESENDAEASAKQDPLPGQLMNETYELTLRQEILNEQAANIMGEIIALRISASFIGLADDVYEDLLERITQVKFGILDARTHEELDEISGYLNCAQDMLAFQLREVA